MNNVDPGIEWTERTVKVTIDRCPSQDFFYLWRLKPKKNWRWPVPLHRPLPGGLYRGAQGCQWEGQPTWELEQQNLKPLLVMLRCRCVSPLHTWPNTQGSSWKIHRLTLPLGTWVRELWRIPPRTDSQDPLPCTTLNPRAVHILLEGAAFPWISQRFCIPPPPRGPGEPEATRPTQSMPRWCDLGRPSWSVSEKPCQRATLAQTLAHQLKRWVVLKVIRR